MWPQPGDSSWCGFACQSKQRLRVGAAAALPSPALILRDCLEMLQGCFPGCTPDGMARDCAPSWQPDRVISSSGFLLAGISAVLPLPAPGSGCIWERKELNDYSWRPWSFTSGAETFQHVGNNPGKSRSRENQTSSHQQGWQGRGRRFFGQNEAAAENKTEQTPDQTPAGSMEMRTAGKAAQAVAGSGRGEGGGRQGQGGVWMPFPGAGSALPALVWAALALHIGASPPSLPGLLALPGTAWTLPGRRKGEQCLL